MSALWWFRLRGTVILSVWWKVVVVTLYTVGVVYVHLHVEGFELNFPQTLISIIGLSVGLLLAFRTNSAYDR
jgi:putative membrane protein